MNMETPVPEELVSSIANFRGDRTQCEIEVRLGTYVQSKFYPGVTKEVFEQLERDFTDAQTLTTDNKWVELLDYHYMNQRDEPARTRVIYDTENMGLSTTHISKRNQEHFIYCRSDDGDESCKISRALEVPLLQPPGTCIPTHVRIKQRKIFQDTRQKNVIWSYELSKTWSANSRSAVEHLQHMSEPRYEVELELIDEDGSYIRDRSDTEIAKSLLMKATMLLGEDPNTPLVLSAQYKELGSGRVKTKRRKIS